MLGPFPRGRWANQLGFSKTVQLTPSLLVIHLVEVTSLYGQPSTARRCLRFWGYRDDRDTPLPLNHRRSSGGDGAVSNLTIKYCLTSAVLGEARDAMGGHGRAVKSTGENSGRLSGRAKFKLRHEADIGVAGSVQAEGGACAKAQGQDSMAGLAAWRVPMAPGLLGSPRG